MAPQSPRDRLSATRKNRRWPAKSVQLRCEQFEEKIAPALFNVGAPLSFPLGTLNNNGCVAVGDFNKDGFLDAAVPNFGTGYGAPFDGGTPGTTITLLYGRAGGGFNRLSLSTGGQNVSFVAIADVNGDTWPDLVALNANRQNTGTVSVFRNDGAGNLSLFGTPFSTGGRNSSWVGLADMTGDNVLDVVVASFGDTTTNPDGTQNVAGQNVTIFQGMTDAQGKGNFTYSAAPITTLAPEVQFFPTALAVADFDGDGIKDIAAAVSGVPEDSGQPQPSGNVYVFRGTGAGGFAAPNLYDCGGSLPVNIQAADVNGDGKRDLIVANAGDPNAVAEFSGNSVGVILNTSTSGSISFGVTSQLLANCYGTFAVAVADFDLNGRPDIAAINYGSAKNVSPNAFVSVYMGSGNGQFTTGSPGMYDLQWNLPGGQYLAVGDFDPTTAAPDLIAVGAVNRVSVLANTTSAGLSVTGVTVNDGTAQRSMVRSVTVAFSGLVTFTGASSAAFQLRQNGSSTNITVNVDLTGSTATQTIAKLTFSGPFTEGNGSLMDGRYTLTVLSSQIQGGLAAGDKVSTLFRMFGDVNGDGAVNNTDLAAFRSTFGLPPGDPNYNAAFDFNGDGVVNNTDLSQFRSRFGTVLPP